MIVAYYAARRRQTKGEVIRAIIRKFGLLDRNLDSGDFLEFVNQEFIPNETEGDFEAGGIGLVAKEFVAARSGS